MRRPLLLLTSLAIFLVPVGAPAYEPPVDTAGPLTVRIVGPEDVTETDVPQPVRVVMENKGEATVKGTLRLGVIDRWTCEPAEAVAFTVEGGQEAELSFRVTAGEGTYSAHYPIHAYARFKHEGKDLAAHPILILQARLPRTPRRRSIAWRPADVPEPGALALWQLPAWRGAYQVFGDKPHVMPIAWQGGDERTGTSVQITAESLDGQRRSAVSIHPPWRGGKAGTAAIEFPLRLPKTTPLKLTFALGQTADGQSDGLTFRVGAVPFDSPAGELGTVLFEKTTVAKSWQPCEVDLSKLAGQAVVLQLESHPGPKNNTGWDRSFWAEPTLRCGSPPEPGAFPPAGESGSRLLGEATCGDGEYEVHVWPGQRGLLDAAVGFKSGSDRLFFRGFEARVLGARLDDPHSPLLLREVKEEPSKDRGLQMRHRFESHLGHFDLLVRLWLDQGVLRAKLWLENTPKPTPWQVVFLEDAAPGPWSRTVSAVYAGHGNVIRGPGPFRLSFDGHRMATSFVGLEFDEKLALLQAVDLPPSHLAVAPGQRHYAMHCENAPTFTFIPATGVWEAVKAYRRTNGLQAAGGVKRAAGRFVFDLWGGRYGPSAGALERAFRYGLTDSMVIWHNWQRWGYDYRLPEIYPPNPRWGALGEMRRLISVCKEAGVPFALHDNYIDFYPDAEGFSYERNIAFHADGRPVQAWLNEGRDARSYRYRSDRVEPYLKANLETIQRELAPTAYFIDVWSSIGPYHYWTADGRLFTRKSSRDAWGRHFAWIRGLLGGDAPQISESGHDQLIGWLDGAQTNHLRVGPPVGEGRYRWAVWNWECEDAERVPWFDAAHHDRFVLHGAGYSARYEGGLDRRLHGIYSDDYICTEVLTGHPGMVPSPFGRDVVRKYWLTSSLARALALKQIETVAFVGDDIHRQHVVWSGGGHVWVNRGESDWDVEGAVLPRYGFLARVPIQGGVVEASIARRDGLIVETARSPHTLYVNGRQVMGGPRAIRPSVGAFRAVGQRGFEMDLAWQADAPIPAGYRPFLHFCDAEGEIVFQAGHRPGHFEKPAQGEIEAKVTGEVPAGAKSGTEYALRAGLYNPEGGERLWLSGPDDGGRRIRLGTLRVEGEGEKGARLSWSTFEAGPDPLLARQNPKAKPVDFGPVVTCGAVRITRDGNAVLVTPLPEGDKPCRVVIRWDKLRWKAPLPAEVEVLDEQGKVTARQPVRLDNEQVQLDCDPGVFSYRLR